MRRRTVVHVLLTSLAAAASLSSAQPHTYAVIVNATNTRNDISRQELAQLFLKKVTRWPQGMPVLPVDLEIGSPTRESFSKNVHGRRAQTIKEYWMKMVFAGRQTPPIVLTSDRDVIEFVASKPGAIGYVSQDANLGSGVKALRISDRTSR